MAAMMMLLSVTHTLTHATFMSTQKTGTITQKTQTGPERQKSRVTLSLAHNRLGHFIYPS